jgi:DNA-binding XRE family transcriptional regulator
MRKSLLEGLDQEHPHVDSKSEASIGFSIGSVESDLDLKRAQEALGQEEVLPTAYCEEKLLDISSTRAAAYLMATYQALHDKANQWEGQDRTGTDTSHSKIMDHTDHTLNLLQIKSSEKLRSDLQEVIARQKEEFTNYIKTNILRLALSAMERDLEKEYLAKVDDDKWKTILRSYIFDYECFEDRIIFLIGAYAPRVTKEILLQLRSKSLEQLEHLLGLGLPRRQTDLPITEGPLFQGSEIATIGTSAPILSAVQSFIREDHWESGDDNEPTFRKQFSQGRWVEHYILDADPFSQYPEKLAQKAAWKIIRQFGLSAAYIHLILAAYAMEQQRPWLEVIRLKGSDLIKTLGQDRRTDLTKAQKLNEVARQAQLVGSLGVWVVWSQGPLELNVRTCRMWDVAIDLHGQLGLSGKVLEPDEITITVRPGLWTEKFLNREGQKEGTALMQFGYLAKQTLKINPYRKPLAAKLAVWLTIMSRIRETFRVETLLRELEPKESLNKAHNDRNARYDLKRRWDAALLELHKLRWRVEFDPETYPEDIQPDWALEDSTLTIKRKLPRGYWRQLLNAKISIRQPEPISQLIAAGIERPREKPRVQTARLTGAQVKESRRAKGWSQRDLAATIGKSAMWVSLIERERLKMQPKDQKFLCEVLQMNLNNCE